MRGRLFTSARQHGVTSVELTLFLTIAACTLSLTPLTVLLSNSPPRNNGSNSSKTVSTSTFESMSSFLGDVVGSSPVLGRWEGTGNMIYVVAGVM
jgi:hypothetical protein